MFAIAFHAFLRIGEITVRSTAVHNPHLIMDNQLLIEGGELTLIFHSYKHSRGDPFRLKAKSTGTREVCPIRVLQSYLALRGSSPGPLFTDRHGGAILRTDFDKALRRAASFNKISTAHFKGHSFRIGAATAAAEAGVPDSQIRELGRWKSDAFKKYIRAASRTSTL